MGKSVFCCNFPPSKVVDDAVALLSTFGEISRAQVVDEVDIVSLLPSRRRRPTLPVELTRDGAPTSGRVAVVEFEFNADADEAVANIDGAVFYGYELIAGVAKT